MQSREAMVIPSDAMTCVHVGVGKNIKIVMVGTINVKPDIKEDNERPGYKCITCGFIGNDHNARYCGKCGQPMQFFNRFPKWNKDGNYYELRSSILDDSEPKPIEWEVVGKGILEEAKRYEKLKELILKEEKEGGSIFRTKKQFLKELLSIIAR